MSIELRAHYRTLLNRFVHWEGIRVKRIYLSYQPFIQSTSDTVNDSCLHIYKTCQISFLYSTRAISTAANSAYQVIEPKKNQSKPPPCPPPPPIKSSSLLGETSRKDKVRAPTPPKKPPRFRIGASGNVDDNTEGSGYDNYETSSTPPLPIKPHSKPMEYEEPGSKRSFKLPFMKRHKTTPTESPNIEEEELYDDVVNSLRKAPLSNTTPTMSTPQSEYANAVSEKEKKKKKLPMIPPRSNTTHTPPPESYQNLYISTEFPGTTVISQDVSVTGPPYYEFEIRPTTLSPPPQPPGSEDASKDSKNPVYYEFEIGPSALSPPPEPPCSETTPTEAPRPSKSFFKLPSIKLLRSKTTPREPTEKYENVEKEEPSKAAVYSNTTPADPSGDGSGSSKKATQDYEFEIGPFALPPPCSETTPTEHEASLKSFFKLPSIKLFRSKTTPREPTEEYENVNEEKKGLVDKLPTYSNTTPPQITGPSGDASKDSKKAAYYEFEVGPSAFSPPPCSETTPTEAPPPSKSFFKLPSIKLLRSKSTSREPTEEYENVNEEKKVPSAPKVPPKTTPPSDVDSKKGAGPMYHEIDVGPAALPTPVQLPYHNLPSTDGHGTTPTLPVVPGKKDKKKKPPKTPKTSLTDVPEAPPTTADTSVKKKEAKKKKPMPPPHPKDPPPEAPATGGSPVHMYHEIDIIPNAVPPHILPYGSSQATITDGPDTGRTYASVNKKNKKPKTPPRPNTPVTEVSENMLTFVDVTVKKETSKKPKTPPRPITPLKEISETLTSVDAPVKKEKPKTLPRPTTPFTEVSEGTSTSAVTKKKPNTLPRPEATPTELTETTPTSVDTKGMKKGKPVAPPRPKNLTARDVGVV